MQLPTAVHISVGFSGTSCGLCTCWLHNREADKLEETELHTDTVDPTLVAGEGGTSGGAGLTVDEKNSAVVIINSSGIIQMANKVGGMGSCQERGQEGSWKGPVVCHVCYRPSSMACAHATPSPPHPSS